MHTVSRLHKVIIIHNDHVISVKIGHGIYLDGDRYNRHFTYENTTQRNFRSWVKGNTRSSRTTTERSQRYKRSRSTANPTIEPNYTVPNMHQSVTRTLFFLSNFDDSIHRKEERFNIPQYSRAYMNHITIKYGEMNMAHTRINLVKIQRIRTHVFSVSHRPHLIIYYHVLVTFVAEPIIKRDEIRINNAIKQNWNNHCQTHYAIWAF